MKTRSSCAAIATIAVASAAVLGVVLKDSYLLIPDCRAGADRGRPSALEEIKRPRSELYFAGNPGLNRLYGQLDLVHDDWLYPVFESMRLAEPRSAWLELALTRGSVRFVVNTSSDSRIDGLDKPLSDLGYIRRFQLGPFFVWENVVRRRPTPPT